MDININTQTVNMLDITIFKAPNFNETQTLSFQLFQKPLNAYLYLHPLSLHPQHVHKSFIASEIKRFYTHCSFTKHSIQHKQNFYKRLLARQYTPTFLDPIFDSALATRSTLIYPPPDEHIPAPPGTRTTQSTHQNTRSPLIFTTEYTNITKHLPLRELLNPGNALRDPDALSVFGPNLDAPLCSFNMGINLQRTFSQSLHTDAYESNTYDHIDNVAQMPTRPSTPPIATLQSARSLVQKSTPRRAFPLAHFSESPPHTPTCIPPIQHISPPAAQYRTHSPTPTTSPQATPSPPEEPPEYQEQQKKKFKRFTIPTKQ